MKKTLSIISQSPGRTAPSPSGRAGVGFLGVGFFLLALTACTNTPSPTQLAQPPAAVAPQIQIPDFNADSAYNILKTQVYFGPRIPNTKQHDECGNYIINEIKKYCKDVTVQKCVVTGYDGTKLKSENIIANFYPEKKTRIMLCAHWDTRPWADQDTEPNWHKPILGANDAASGVAVLIELARHLAAQQPNVGITMVFLDAEDYGAPEFTEQRDEDSYALGTQYWAKSINPDKYFADYGILLDMVGGKNPRFMMEGVSMEYAPGPMKNVWDKAAALGYGDMFIARQTSPIIDDHVYVNRIARIPTLDIVDYDASRHHGFPDTWHTLKDNMDNIDKNTLKAVGQTLLAVIYGEKGAE